MVSFTEVSMIDLEHQHQCSHLINWGCNPFWCDSLGLLSNLSNLIRTISQATSLHWSWSSVWMALKVHFHCTSTSKVLCQRWRSLDAEAQCEQTLMLIYKERRVSTIINANKQHLVYFDENKERRTEAQEDAFYSCADLGCIYTRL